MILWLDLKNPRDDVNSIRRLWTPMNSILNTSSNTSTNTNVNANVSLLWMVIRNIDITNYTSKSIYPSSNSKISHCSCHSRNSRGANICNFHCLVQVMRGLAKRKEIYIKKTGNDCIKLSHCVDFFELIAKNSEHQSLCESSGLYSTNTQLFVTYVYLNCNVVWSILFFIFETLANDKIGVSLQ